MQQNLNKFSKQKLKKHLNCPGSKVDLGRPLIAVIPPLSLRLAYSCHNISRFDNIPAKYFSLILAKQFSNADKGW